MKDLLGVEIEIGDEVVFSANEYVSVSVSKVVGFGKKKVLLERTSKYPWNNPNISRYPTEIVVLKKATKIMSEPTQMGMGV